MPGAVGHDVPSSPGFQYGSVALGGFPYSWGLPENDGFLMENPFQMGCFGGTPILGNLHNLAAAPSSK